MAPFLQPQLVAAACTQTEAGGQKTVSGTAINYMHKPWPCKHWLEKPKFFDFITFLLNTIATSWFLPEHTERDFLLQFHQLPAPGQCKMCLSFLLLPDEAQFYL